MEGVIKLLVIGGSMEYKVYVKVEKVVERKGNGEIG